MGRDWRWGFGCVSHTTTGGMIYSDSDRGAAKPDVINLWRHREHLLALDQEFWAQDYYQLILFLHQHQGCQVALTGPDGEVEPLEPASGNECAPVPAECSGSAGRAIVWLGEDQILHALAGADQGFRVLGVYAAPERTSICIVVEHPRLPATVQGEPLPRLRGRWLWSDVQVHVSEGSGSTAELCVVPRLLVDQLPAG